MPVCQRILRAIAIFLAALPLSVAAQQPGNTGILFWERIERTWPRGRCVGDR